MVESPSRGTVGGGGVIFRVKRRREEEPLDALLVAERASKRGSGVSLQSCMDSLSLGLGAQNAETGYEAGGAGGAGGAEGSGAAGENGAGDDMANSSCSSAQHQDSTRKVFKLLGSVPQAMDTDHQLAVAGAFAHLADTSVGDVSQLSSPDRAGGLPGSADKVRELIRKMTSGAPKEPCKSAFYRQLHDSHGRAADNAARPALSASAQRQKELARIVDLEVEQGDGGGVKFRSAPSPGQLKGDAVTSPQGMGKAGSESPAACTPCLTPAGKGIGNTGGNEEGTEVSPDGEVGGGSILLCNGSPLIRESVGPSSPGARGEEGGGGGGGGKENGDEYVYDYYWIDPDEGGMGRDIAGGKVANVEVDLDDLWDDDKLILEEENWDSDQIEDSGEPFFCADCTGLRSRRVQRGVVAVVFLEREMVPGSSLVLKVRVHGR